MRAKTMHKTILCSDSLHRALSKTTSFHILIYIYINIVLAPIYSNALIPFIEHFLKQPLF